MTAVTTWCLSQCTARWRFELEENEREECEGWRRAHYLDRQILRLMRNKTTV